MVGQARGLVYFRLWRPYQAQWLVLPFLFTALILIPACQGDAPANEGWPTATGTRVVAPTRDEAPAQTVAPFRGQVIIPSGTPALTLTPLLLLIKSEGETLVYERVCPPSAVISRLESGTEWAAPLGTTDPETCAENGRHYWPVVLDDGRTGWVDTEDVTAVR
jgi:hypothetical protein